VADFRLQKRKERDKGRLTAEVLVALHKEPYPEERKVIALMADIHMEDLRVSKAFASYYESLFLFIKDYKGNSSQLELGLERHYAKIRRIEKHLEFLVKLLKLK